MHKLKKWWYDLGPYQKWEVKYLSTLVVGFGLMVIGFALIFDGLIVKILQMIGGTQ